MSAEIVNSDSVISKTIDLFANGREFPKTHCPSEVARALPQSFIEHSGGKTWRDMMPAVRAVVWDRTLNGELEILQKGEVQHVASLDDLTGPIRVRKVSTES